LVGFFLSIFVLILVDLLTILESTYFRTIHCLNQDLQSRFFGIRICRILDKTVRERNQDAVTAPTDVSFVKAFLL